jgi:gamma-glutamylcysteine synthetase
MNERQFLDPLFRILQNKETGAEKLIKKYNTTWNKSINKIFTENSY